MMRIVVPMVLAFTVAASAQADKVVKSNDGSCQLTVPSAWTAGGFGLANSPDKKVTATVSSPKMMDSFSQLKQTAPTVYPNSKVTKDSATEFEMEGQSQAGKPDVYRAIPIAASKFCIAEVIYQNGTADDARAIVRTLKAAK
jgi:hypothetical protein